jgi:hypothetical protein
MHYCTYKYIFPNIYLQLILIYLLYPFEEESSMSMSSSIIKVCHTGGEMGIVGMRQLILGMGLVSVEVRILAQKATTPSKRFSPFTFYYHRCVNCGRCAVKMLVLIICCFFFCRLKITT